jgi:hypothetical protein
MPGNPRAIITEAESRFPIRIAIRVPLDGFGQRYAAMCIWLDENCGINGWSIAPAGTRGILNDAVAVYVKHRLAPWALWPAGASLAIRRASMRCRKTNRGAGFQCSPTRYRSSPPGQAIL